ncbi:MAG TPA: protein-disulfide reductase DsbD domain-containing protein [Clostridia bacterium]|nr:protein-disulfide reductase DsbD domain-containing protein [Clostridia bacterium]
MKRISIALAFVLVLVGSALAQNANTQPSVTIVPADPVVVRAGSSSPAQLVFRVNSGFHINSNKPNSELLIPTSLKLSPPTEVMIAGVKYPAGEQLVFPFSPDEKLSVYSGDFKVSALVRAARGTPVGTYRVHGELKYQACNNRQCFPPKTVPVFFDVRIAKGSRR